MNIYLVGFMGTGKSVVGRRLAKILKFEFADLDAMIEEKENRQIKDIFAREGEAYFRQVEKETVKEISKKSGIVAACGGGVVIDAENVKLLKESGVMICLTARPEVIYERTKHLDERPLLNVEDPRKEIQELLDKRAEFYAKADFTIETTSKSIEEVVREIIEILKKRT